MASGRAAFQFGLALAQLPENHGALKQGRPLKTALVSHYSRTGNMLSSELGGGVRGVSRIPSEVTAIAGPVAFRHGSRRFCRSIHSSVG